MPSPTTTNNSFINYESRRASWPIHRCHPDDVCHRGGNVVVEGLVKKRHIIYHDLSTAKGREAFNRAYRAKHGLDEPSKTSALPPRIVFKPLLPAERGKLGLCPSTRLEAFKATPFPGSFKLGPKQRLHRWLCDECGFWHGQAVNLEDDNLPPDEPTTVTVTIKVKRKKK